VFSWHLRIGSQPELICSGVITDLAGSVCALCGLSTESVDYLFVTCGVASELWYRIFRWLGWLLVLPRDLVGLFDVLLGLDGRVKIRRGFLLIWHTVVWTIWTARNDLVFSSMALDVEELVHKIQFSPWF